MTQRECMGRGFKKLLSIAMHATVRPRDQELWFTAGNDGIRCVIHQRGFEPQPGFVAGMKVEHDEAGRDLSGYFRSFLLLLGVVLVVNGIEGFAQWVLLPRACRKPFRIQTIAGCDCTSPHAG